MMLASCKTREGTPFSMPLFSWHHHEESEPRSSALGSWLEEGRKESLF